METKAVVITIFLLAIVGCVDENAKDKKGKGAETGVVEVPPSPTPTSSPSLSTPTPTPTPAPVASYDCTNHPLSGTTVSIRDNPAQSVLEVFEFNADCSYREIQSDHISLGQWAPDPDPYHAQFESGAAYNNQGYWHYPITLSPSGAYICLPANGPQNCTNSGWAGVVAVKVSVDYPTEAVRIYP